MEATFLVTNDDGIEVYFIRAIAEKLRQFGQVCLAAPSSEQSWIGRAVSRYREIEVARFDGYAGIDAWQVSGTPTDTVNIAIGHLMPKPPQVVVSGINIGYNLLAPVLLSSGTVAAALEGAAWGIPAVAFSFQLRQEDFLAIKASPANPSPQIVRRIDLAAQRGAEFAAAMAGQDNPQGLVHNVNFPSNLEPDTPWVSTQPSKIRMGSLFTKQSHNTYRFRYLDSLTPRQSTTLPGDYETLLSGKISHSILNLMEY